MQTLFARLTTAVILTVFSAFAIAQDDAVVFTGSESGSTADFSTGGPWLLDWSVHSDYPEMTNFEMRLYDASSGDFIGTIAQLEGTGRGLKLFEDAGEYRIQIVAQSLDWELQIVEVGTAQAARLKRATSGEATLEDRLQKEVLRIPKDAVASWRAESDRTLLLFDADQTRGFRVEFASGCTGLSDATAISFVTAPESGLERYNSILLDDGTRCYFSRVTPTVLN